MQLARRPRSLRRAAMSVVATAAVALTASVGASSAHAHGLPHEAFGVSQLQALAALGLKQSAAETIPDAVGYAVTDVDSARSQLAAATGTAFAPVERTRPLVTFPAEKQLKQVSFAQTRSVRGGPAIELVEADPALGPWAAGRFAIPYMTYYVGDRLAKGRELRQAGLRRVAVAKDFVFWQGREGHLVKLVEGTAPASGVNVPQAPMDLGAPAALVYSPCDAEPFAQEIASALGISWRPKFIWAAQWQLSDGSASILEAINDIAFAGPPFVTIETPHHATAEFGCATHRHLHPVLVADDVPAAEAQMEAAGMAFIARVPGVVAYSLTDTGIFVEVAHTSFLGAIG